MVVLYTLTVRSRSVRADNIRPYDWVGFYVGCIR